MKPLQVVFPSRADPESPIVDLDLHLPLLCFRPEKVLQVCGRQEQWLLRQDGLGFIVGVGHSPQPLGVNPRTAKMEAQNQEPGNLCTQSIRALYLDPTLKAAVSLSSSDFVFVNKMQEEAETQPLVWGRGLPHPALAGSNRKQTGSKRCSCSPRS